MLKGFLDKIKSKLPERFRGEEDEFDDEDEFEDEDDRTVEVDVEAIQQANAEADEEYDDEEDDDLELDDEEEEKKEKKKKLIRVGLIALIALLVISEFIPTGEDNSNDTQAPSEDAKQQAVLERMKKRREARRKKNQAQPKEEAAEKPIVVEATPNVEPVSLQPTPLPTIEPIAVQPTPIPTIAPIEENFESSVNIEDENQNELSETTNTELGEREVEESQPVSNVEEPIEQESKAGQSLLDSINELKKIEYTKPPNYEKLGRGLVYNCTGKHWACVDRKSYFSCHQNQQWSEQNSKQRECAIVNVYASYDDCKLIQIHNINTLEKPPCN